MLANIREGLAQAERGEFEEMAVLSGNLLCRLGNEA
jgi:predicted transcriptional regulator